MALLTELACHDVLHNEHLLQNRAREHLSGVRMTRDCLNVNLLLNCQLNFDALGVWLRPNEPSIDQPHLNKTSMLCYCAQGNTEQDNHIIRCRRSTPTLLRPFSLLRHSAKSSRDSSVHEIHCEGGL